MLNIQREIQIATNVARALSGKPLTIHFERSKDNFVCYTTGNGEIHISEPSTSMSSQDFGLWMAALYHEIGHHARNVEDDFEVAKEADMRVGSLNHLVMNMIGDYCQERHKWQEFEGRRRLMAQAHRVLSENTCDGITKMTHDPTNKYRTPLAGLWGWDLKHRANWNPELQPVVDAYERSVPPEVKKVYNKLNSGDYGDVLDIDCDCDKGKRGPEKVDLVNRIIREIFELDPEEEKKKGQKPEKGKGKDKKGKKDKSDSAEGEGEEGAEQGDGPQEADYEDMLKHHHDVDVSTSTSPMKIHYKPDYSYAAYTPYPPSMIALVDTAGPSVIVTDATGKAFTHSDPHMRSAEHRFRSFDRYSPYKCMEFTKLTDSNKLSKRLQRLFMIRSRGHYIYGQRRGKIHNKNLHRMMVPNLSYAQRVFRRKVESEMTDTDVSLLVDCSGSMGGDKFEHAGAAGILMSELLESININHELAGFTDFYTTCVHFLFKPFGKKIHKAQLAKGLSLAGSCLNQNADGDSILVAYNRLLSQPGKRKLLVVLSDGSPAGGRGGDIRGFTEKVIKEIENARRTEIYGIGIMDDNVTMLYKNNTVINNITELEDCLLNLIKVSILRDG